MRKVEDASKEVPAISQLLRVLDLMDCAVTIDAIGCQKVIAQTIPDRKADCILAV